MRKLIVAGAMLSLLSACGTSSGVFGRNRPDEFAVSRAAPLVVPPDFALAPPAPGAPRPQEADSSTQALQAMFGGQAPRSAVEGAAVTQAGANRSQTGIRANAGDPETNVVDKGSVTRDIIAAPEGDGANAKVATPQ
jgi:hypothetical protein